MKKAITRYLMTAFCICLLSTFAKAQNCDLLTAAQLREMVSQLGYTVKDLNTTAGKEKFEIVNTTNGFNIPMGVELSASKNFIWFTVFLGPPKADTSVNNMALLKQNAKIQPCQFYVSEKGNLMLGLAIENRGLTNALLRKHSDKVFADVASTAVLWQTK